MLHVDTDIDVLGPEAVDKWLYTERPAVTFVPSEEELGLDYQPPARRAPAAPPPAPRQTAVDVTACVVCEAALTPLQVRRGRHTCGAVCASAHLKKQRQEMSSRRYTYACTGCEKKYEVGFSMWHEVRARGLLCAKCHTARRTVTMEKTKPLRTRPAPCNNCVHGYKEPAAYLGYACQLNHRKCWPEVYASLYVAKPDAAKQ